MANSIAKLAVVITGDTGPLSSELKRASAAVNSWSAGMARMAAQNDKWAAGMAKIVAANKAAVNPFADLNTQATRAAGAMDSMHGRMFKLNTLMSAFRGNVGAAFMVGGPAALGIAAMSLGVFKLASAGDALLTKLGADKLQTWAGQWERLGEAVGVTGNTFAVIAREATSGLADTLERINSALFPSAVAETGRLRAIQAELAATKELAEITAKFVRDTSSQKEFLSKKEQKALDEVEHIRAKVMAQQTIDGVSYQKELDRIDRAQKKLTDANFVRGAAAERDRNLQTQFDDMRDRAKSLAEAVRTPREELVATFAELNSLFQAGAMTANQYEQTVMRTAEEFLKEQHKALKPVSATRGVAAAERFTSAGFSAGEAGKREMDRLEKSAKLQAERQAQTNMILARIEDAIKNNKPIELVQGDLN